MNDWPPSVDASYFTIRDHDTVHQTLTVNDRTLVDIDEAGRILGVETIGGTEPEWYAIVTDSRFGMVP